MKLKPAVSKDAPPDLVRALNGVRQQVLDEVIGPHLHRPEFGPAEFYVQVCDIGDPSAGLFCEVRLSGVSRTDDRTEEDFAAALDALANIYRRHIGMHLNAGQRMQLMVTIMVDTPPALYETAAEWVESSRPNEFRRDRDRTGI